jgi:hypothetical protein
MTVGLLIPAVAALGWLLVLPGAIRQLRDLPTRISPGFDEAQAAARGRGLRLVIGAQLITPLLLYLILNNATDFGRMELF